MRGSIDGLGSSAPLGRMLPAIFADDDLAQRFVAGLDEVLAPILTVLDCLDAYFTPSLAPLDFTAWLGCWIGAETDDASATPGGWAADRPGGAQGADDGTQNAARLRAAVAAAARLHRIRGTRHGLSEAIRLAFGVEPEITESGGAAWSARPLGPFPGDRQPYVRVVVRLPNPVPADQHRLDTLVSAARPAHMPCTAQVIAAEGNRNR